MADAALATKENLSLMGDDIRFITRGCRRTSAPAAGSSATPLLRAPGKR